MIVMKIRISTTYTMIMMIICFVVEIVKVIIIITNNYHYDK